MISHQVVIDALQASDHIITQHNLMSTASPEEVTATLHRLFDWRNGVVHTVLQAWGCGNDQEALRQVLRNAEQMTLVLAPTMTKPLLEARQRILTAIQAALHADAVQEPTTALGKTTQAR